MRLRLLIATLLVALSACDAPTAAQQAFPPISHDSFKDIRQISILRARTDPEIRLTDAEAVKKWTTWAEKINNGWVEPAPPLENHKATIIFVGPQGASFVFYVGRNWVDRGRKPDAEHPEGFRPLTDAESEELGGLLKAAGV